MMLNLLHFVLWASVAWMCFCRSAILDGRSKWIVSWGVSGLGTVAVAMAVAPFVPGWDYQVRLADIVIGSAVSLNLYAFKGVWRDGIPKGAEHEGIVPTERRTGHDRRVSDREAPSLRR